MTYYNIKQDPENTDKLILVREEGGGDKYQTFLASFDKNILKEIKYLLNVLEPNNFYLRLFLDMQYHISLDKMDDNINNKKDESPEEMLSNLLTQVKDKELEQTLRRIIFSSLMIDYKMVQKILLEHNKDKDNKKISKIIEVILPVGDDPQEKYGEKWEKEMKNYIFEEIHKIILPSTIIKIDELDNFPEECSIAANVYVCGFEKDIEKSIEILSKNSMLL